MLKSTKNNLIINNAIELGENISLEDKGKGRHFTSRFIEAGLAHYQEFGDVLITKETLDKFVYTMVGCPVIIRHKDITKDNVDKERVGVVSKVWYNELDGWYWCEGIIWDKQAIDLIKNQGWSVSCTYDFESDFKKGTYHGKDYDMEFTGGEFLHLALVDNPRYERANIVVNSKDEEKEEKSNNVNNERELTMSVLNELTEFIQNVVNNKGDDMEEKEKVDNEKVDKRDIIRQIMAIAGKEEASEDVKTIAKLAEKLAYDDSEDSKADNKAKNEEDEEKEEKFEEEKEIAENKCKNEEEKKEDKEEKAENEEEEKEEEKKEGNNCKNSLDETRKIVFGGKQVENTKYIPISKRIEMGNQY